MNKFLKYLPLMFLASTLFSCKLNNIHHNDPINPDMGKPDDNNENIDKPETKPVEGTLPETTTIDSNDFFNKLDEINQINKSVPESLKTGAKVFKDMHDTSSKLNENNEKETSDKQDYCSVTYLLNNEIYQNASLKKVDLLTDHLLDEPFINFEYKNNTLTAHRKNECLNATIKYDYTIQVELAQDSRAGIGDISNLKSKATTYQDLTSERIEFYKMYYQFESANYDFSYGKNDTYQVFSMKEKRQDYFVTLVFKDNLITRDTVEITRKTQTLDQYSKEENLYTTLVNDQEIKKHEYKDIDIITDERYMQIMPYFLLIM